MLRLWPETLYGGLFPGHSWLTGGRGQALLSDAAGVDAGDLLAGLETMLSQLPQGLGRRRMLNLVVSDSIAAIATLPWQQHLTGQDELNAYAHACFEQQGRVIDATWVAQTAFRQYRGAGLAFALPHVWLSRLLALCEKFQVRLKTVLPVSAAAFWRVGAGSTAGKSVVLLAETQRMTAMVYEQARLLRVDVQPVISQAGATGERLLRRIAASDPSVEAVCYWSSAASDFPPPFVGVCLPTARLSHLRRDAWGR